MISATMQAFGRGERRSQVDETEYVVELHTSSGPVRTTFTDQEQAVELVTTYAREGKRFTFSVEGKKVPLRDVWTAMDWFERQPMAAKSRIRAKFDGLDKSTVQLLHAYKYYRGEAK